MNRARRWSFGLMLALTVGVGPLVLYAISTLAPFMTRDLGLSRTQLGSLATIAFACAMASSASSGALNDRFGDRRVLVALYLLAGLSVTGVAAAPGYAWMVPAMALAGISMAATNPVTNRLVLGRLPPGQRGLLLGFKQSGVQIAQIFAGATLPPVAVLAGWRVAMLTALVMVAGGLLMATRLVHPAEPGLAPADTAREGGGGDFARGLALFALLFGVVVQGANVYLPLYAFEEVGFTAAAAGMLAGVVGAVSMLARVLWGRIAERTKTASGPLAAVVLLGAGAMAALLAAPAVGAPALFAGVVLFGFSAPASTVILMVAVVRWSPPAEVGRASGRVMRGVYAGYMLGPVTFGALVDATGSYVASLLLMMVLCGLSLVICLAQWGGRATPGVDQSAVNS